MFLMRASMFPRRSFVSASTFALYFSLDTMELFISRNGSSSLASMYSLMRGGMVAANDLAFSLILGSS